MKKLITAFGLSALATAAFTQGTVNPGNGATTLMHTNTISPNDYGIAPGSGPTPPTLGGIYYEVLTAPSTVTTVDASLQGLLTGPWSDTGLRLTNTAFASGGRISGPSGSAGVVNNWAPGMIQSFIIVGWSAN